MNDIVIKINAATATTKCKDKKIGVKHANLQNKLIFEMTEKIHGSAWLEYEIDGNKEYAEMEEIDNGYQIDIRSCLLISDYVSVDLKITESGTPEGIPVFISTITTLEVYESINAKKEQPEYYPDWKTIADSKIAEMDQLKRELNTAEQNRVSAENERNENEVTRNNNETTRQENEANRQTNETNRVNSEEDRETAENERNLAEISRNNNETTRQDNETVRNNNEETRNNQEIAREEYITDLKRRVDEGEFDGECNFATFEIDISTGELVMHKTEDLLLDFDINERGYMEVLI